MNRTALGLAIAGSVLGALAASPASAANLETCYGVSLKGQNDCASSKHGCAGQGTADYSPSDWKSVPEGTCKTLTVNGHKGSLTPS
jgi:uncharacterized membrane protein